MPLFVALLCDNDGHVQVIVDCAHVNRTQWHVVHLHTSLMKNISKKKKTNKNQKKKNQNIKSIISIYLQKGVRMKKKKKDRQECCASAARVCTY